MLAFAVCTLWHLKYLFVPHFDRVVFFALSAPLPQLHTQTFKYTRAHSCVHFFSLIHGRNCLFVLFYSHSDGNSCEKQFVLACVFICKIFLPSFKCVNIIWREATRKNKKIHSYDGMTMKNEYKYVYILKCRCTHIRTMTAKKSHAHTLLQKNHLKALKHITE